MNPFISEELQEMYRNMISRENGSTFARMMAAFASGPPPMTTELSLTSEIPRGEIECDIEIVLAKSFRDSLKKLNSNMSGLSDSKSCFREVIELVNSKVAYPASPTPGIKRDRTTSFGSSISPGSELKMEDDSNDSKRSRLANDTATTFDDSNASSHDGSLQIDLDESKDRYEPERALMEPTVEIKEQDYKPSNLRVVRLRDMQKLRPKFDMDDLDLTYHSSMARAFPGSENRTEEQNMRRAKNTVAARVSRTKNKLYEKMLETQSVEETNKNITMKRRIACLRAYTNALMSANGLPETNFSEVWENNIKDSIEKEN